MPVAFDTTIPIATPQRREDLIDAIITAADKHGETHWLEWKSECDLGARAGTFELAKEILALANRDVSTAQADCGGGRLPCRRGERVRPSRRTRLQRHRDTAETGVLLRNWP